jgi:glucose/arabinose dehydrogenase
MRKRFSPLAALCGLLLCSTLVNAQPVISYQTLTTGLTQPIDLADPGDGSGRLFIVQQGGLVRIWNGTALEGTPFLDLSGVITSPRDNEQGLLSLVFHPAYSSNRYFFVLYTNSTGAITLARYRTRADNAGLADASSGQVLLTIAKPGSPYYTNHNGGKLLFGADGMLYLGTGDGGSGGDPGNNAQNGASLLGKMLRLDVSAFATSPPYYTIPADNPYAAAGDGIADEIWALGLRNPWRWSFDRTTNDMWIADVGQGAWEEVNYRPAGSTGGVNYGWRCREGAHNYNTSGCTSGYTDPVFEYGHNSTTGGFSITGGYVYRGTEFPVLNGYYITADFVTGNLWLVSPNGSGGFTSHRQGGLSNNISSFGEDAAGNLYALRRSSGTLFRLAVSGVLPVVLSRFAVTRQATHNAVEWATGSESNTRRFLVQYSTDGSTFLTAGEVAAAGTPRSYRFRHTDAGNATLFYRLLIEDVDGSIRYSGTVRVAGSTTGIRVYPTVVRNRQLFVEGGTESLKLELFNAAGALIHNRELRPAGGRVSVILPQLAKGLYRARLSGAAEVVTTTLWLEE